MFIWEFFFLKIVIYVFDGYVLVLVNFFLNFILFIVICVLFVVVYLSFFLGYLLIIYNKDFIKSVRFDFVMF